jgi:hypothetical protein
MLYRWLTILIKVNRVAIELKLIDQWVKNNFDSYFA